MTRAPIATANCVADNPTGPCPKIAIVSRPERPTRRSAPYAVPVPHEIAAPVSNDRPSGRGTNVLDRHLHVPSVSAITGDAVDGRALDAHLRPPCSAMRAQSATGVVMH